METGPHAAGLERCLSVKPFVVTCVPCSQDGVVTKIEVEFDSSDGIDRYVTENGWAVCVQHAGLPDPNSGDIPETLPAPC